MFSFSRFDFAFRQSGSIGIEATSGFFPQVPSIDHVHQQRTGAILGVLEAVMENIADG